MRFTLSKPSGSAFYGHPCPKRLNSPSWLASPQVMCIFIFSEFSAKYDHDFVKSFSSGSSRYPRLLPDINKLYVICLNNIPFLLNKKDSIF